MSEEKLLSALRQLRARLIDYDDIGVPSSLEECLLEFTLLEEELMEIINSALGEMEEQDG